MIKDLAKGPLYRAKSFSRYYVNGYKFHTEERGSNSGEMNSGVCIKGFSHSVNELEYYGRLQEILELEYPALPIKRIVLFKCSWFDPILNRGTRIHPQYKLVDVKSGRVFNKYEPFILAMQAAQVYFASYPTLKRNVNDCLAVCKIKARGIVEVPKSVRAPPPGPLRRGVVPLTGYRGMSHALFFRLRESSNPRPKGHIEMGSNLTTN